MDYPGRCFVECKKYVGMQGQKLPRVYFKNYRTAIRFSYYWTKRCGYFCQVYEYHKANYWNDFHEGYDWMVSVRNGMNIASSNYTLQHRLLNWDHIEIPLRDGDLNGAYLYE